MPETQQLPAPQPAESSNREALERRRQLRGLLALILLILAFSITRAGIYNVFTQGWWHFR